MAAGTIHICDSHYCHWDVGHVRVWCLIQVAFVFLSLHDSLPFGTPGRFLWRICHRPGFRLLQLGPIWRYSYRFVEDNVPKTIKNNWTPPMEVYINVISHVVSQVLGILGKNGCGMVGMVWLLGFDFAAHQQTWNTHLRSRCVVPGAGYVSRSLSIEARQCAGRSRAVEFSTCNNALGIEPDTVPLICLFVCFVMSDLFFWGYFWYA